jgi:RecG-like helicase
LPLLPHPKQPLQNPLAQSYDQPDLRRAIDLALHLPLRYEDETHRAPRGRARRRGGTEGEVTHSEVLIRSRRQLLVTVDDGSDTCRANFIRRTRKPQRRRPGRCVAARGLAARRWHFRWLAANCRAR